MRCCRLLWPLLLLAGGQATFAQTFDLDQFDQLFRPRLRVEGHWLPQAKSPDGNGRYEDRTAMAVLTFPIHGTFNVNARIDPDAGSLKELLNNSLRLRASQVMGTVRYGTRQVIFGEGGGAPRTLHTASVGALGVSLTKRLRVLFWSVNVNISEEDRTLDRAVPRFGGLIGKMKVKGLRRQFFHGLAAGYSDGLFLPIPFIGGSAPMGQRWSFNYVLPLQVSLACRAGRSARVYAGMGLDGQRSGLDLDGVRANLTHSGLRAFTGIRYRSGKRWTVRAEAGWMIRHRLGFDGAGVPDGIDLGPGPMVMVGAGVFLGGSVLERILDDVFRWGDR